jgi:hypothetical protein
MRIAPTPITSVRGVVVVGGGLLAMTPDGCTALNVTTGMSAA